MIKHGGENLFDQHKLLDQALKEAYPEFSWDPLRFRASTKGTGQWQQKSNIIEALEKAERRLSIENV